MVQQGQQRVCQGGCGFAATWHTTHCCNGCAATGNHGPRCEKKFAQCPGGCGFAVTWHKSHCCAKCAQHEGHHGGACEKVSAKIMPAASTPKAVKQTWQQVLASSQLAAKIPSPDPQPLEEAIDVAERAATQMMFIDDAFKLPLPAGKLSASTIYFIHIPKTSGSSFGGEKLCKMGHKFNVGFSYRAPAHLYGYAGYTGPRAEFWPRYGFPTASNLKIAVVRNPFDHLVSYYLHGSELRPNAEYCHSGWAAVNFTHQFHSFEEFVRAYCDPDFKWHMPLFKQFLPSQLFNDKDDCVADLLFKFESLKTSLPELEKVGIHLHRGDKNKSKRREHKSYKDFYTPELRALVEKKCARELRAFGYDFDGNCTHSNFIIPRGLKYNVAGDRLYAVDEKASEETIPKLCAGGCGFAATWHPTHCCNGCATRGNHGPRCERIHAVSVSEAHPESKQQRLEQTKDGFQAEKAQVTLAPPTKPCSSGCSFAAEKTKTTPAPVAKPCASGCGFAVTWHKTYCCAACAKNGTHGPRCQQIECELAAAVCPALSEMVGNFVALDFQTEPPELMPPMNTTIEVDADAKDVECEVRAVAASPTPVQTVHGSGYLGSEEELPTAAPPVFTAEVTVDPVAVQTQVDADANDVECEVRAVAASPTPVQTVQASGYLGSQEELQTAASPVFTAEVTVDPVAVQTQVGADAKEVDCEVGVAASSTPVQTVQASGYLGSQEELQTAAPPVFTAEVTVDLVAVQTQVFATEAPFVVVPKKVLDKESEKEVAKGYDYLPFEIRDVPVLLLKSDGYLVDNSLLKSQLTGLTCCSSKNIEAKDERIIDFGSTVDGIVEQSDDGTKWLKIKAEAHEYLPFQIRDVPVLQHKGDGYLVDNSLLKSQLTGLTCRNSKDHKVLVVAADNNRGGRVLDFGTIVEGIVEQSEDGMNWLKVKAEASEWVLVDDTAGKPVDVQTIQETQQAQPVQAPPSCADDSADVCLCAGGCGYVVTWHATHCCKLCAALGTHGPRCDRKAPEEPDNQAPQQNDSAA